jgi:hypothetical protein
VSRPAADHAVEGTVGVTGVEGAAGDVGVDEPPPHDASTRHDTARIVAALVVKLIYCAILLSHEMAVNPPTYS